MSLGKYIILLNTVGMVGWNITIGYKWWAVFWAFTLGLTVAWIIVDWKSGGE